MTTEPTVQAFVFDRFDQFAHQKGLDFDDLLRAEGLVREQLAGTESVLPLNAVARILERAAEASGDPCLGLHWAEAYPASARSIIGYCLLNAKSVRDAVRAVARYVNLHLDPVDVRFEEAEGIGRLEWRFSAAFSAPRTQYASFAMTMLIIRLRHSAGPQWMPMGVELEHRELPCRDEVLRILGPNVKFNCIGNALQIRETILNRRSHDADVNLFNLIRQLAERLLAERPATSDIVHQTERAIVDCIESGNLTLEEISGAMGTPPRTLQNKLAAAGTNFETVLQETRQRLAECYLRDTDLPLTEIAILLGFSELSAFTRAAGRWFGAPPSVHRFQARQSASSSGSGIAVES